MPRFLRGAACGRRRRQTARFEFAAGDRPFGFLSEPVTLRIPPLSFFGLSGELGESLLIYHGLIMRST
jgi:hypothetical protein